MGGKKFSKIVTLNPNMKKKKPAMFESMFDCSSDFLKKKGDESESSTNF